MRTLEPLIRAGYFTTRKKDGGSGTRYGMLLVTILETGGGGLGEAKFSPSLRESSRKVKC